MLRYAAFTICSSAAAASSSNRGSERRQEEITARGSGSIFAERPLTNRSTSSPDQADSAARLSTSGRLPCEIRVRVDALTPLSSATRFHVHWRACLSPSRAAKKEAPSNVARLTTERLLEFRYRQGSTIAMNGQLSNSHGTTEQPIPISPGRRNLQLGRL